MKEGAMKDMEERWIGDWVVRIDQLICVGFGDCIDEVGPWFQLDEDGIATFHPAPPDGTPETLLQACKACPVDALTIHDREGRRLAP